VAVAAAPRGQIAIAGADPRRRARSLVIIQGPASGPFAPLTGGEAGAPTLSTAYLGDLGILAPLAETRTRGLAVSVERHYGARAATRTLIRGAAAIPEALALDYRSDALAVWEEKGQLYAADAPASGAPGHAQRLGPAGPDPRVAALLSDDNRGIVLWVDDSSSATRVYLDYSATGLRFGRPRLLESFEDPDGLAPPAGSPQLVRLSSEGVMAAWAGVAAGHWVLRAAPIDQRGLLRVTTIANPGGDALLSSLAPGPGGEAVILWREPTITAAGRPALGRQRLLAARGGEQAPGVASFGPAELVAPPGPVSGASLAVDPDSGLVLAAWLGEGGAVRWSARAQTPGG